MDRMTQIHEAIRDARKGKYPPLRACPLCGSVETEYTPTFHPGQDDMSWGVECGDCGLYLDASFRTAEEAARRWNTREGQA